MNITITSANVSKVIAVATAIYWAIVGWVLWSFRSVNGLWPLRELWSGDWVERGGAWIPVLFLANLCGAGSWVVLGPTALRALKTNRHPLSAKRFGAALWCLSTVPVIMLHLGLIILIACQRLIATPG